MRIYWFQSKRADDDEAEADYGYLKWFYEHARIACPTCWDVLPEHRDRPIDVDLAAGASLRVPALSVSHVSVEIVRIDLLECLQSWLTADFHVGSVTMQGAPLQQYRTLLAGTSVRVPTHGAGTSYVYSCPKCGRRCPVIKPRGVDYVVREELGNLMVCSSDGGNYLRVRSEVWEDLPELLRSELYANPIRVRDGPRLELGTGRR